MAAPTYFGSASTPADNGANGALTTTITPPGSMVAGDLVVVHVSNRTNSATWSVGLDGGQTWTAETAYIPATGALGCRIFWCRYDGTWDVSPRFDCTASTGNTAIMHVFRPDSGSKLWAIDVAQVTGQFAAPTTPFTVTITGRNTVAADTVTLACWSTFDDNTWNSLSGTGWAVTGSAQYRNTDGSDTSSTFAHYLAAAAATAVPNVSKNQLTLGGDLGCTAIITWKAYAAAAGFKHSFGFVG